MKVGSACSNQTVRKEDVGAPDAIICDMASKQLSSEMKQFFNATGMTLRALDECTPWANKAKLYIKVMKEVIKKDMREADSLLPFWDYCIERARDHIKTRGMMPHTATTGAEGDIPNLCRYKWYDSCYYREHTVKFPHNQEVLWYVLGPARGEGNEMAQWVIKANGNVIPRHSL